jgi:ATP/maltotriose-dependent transcriptional regulator MalT
MSGPGPAERGWIALGEGAWQEARAAFEEALRQGENPEVLGGLAEASFWLGDGRSVIDVSERAFRLFRDRGEDEAAAGTAAKLAMAVLNILGDTAVATGWLQRARSLLRDHPDSPVLTMVVGLEGALAGRYEKDFARARHLSEEARARARAMGDIDMEMLATGQLGLVRVAAGEVAEGMRLLDEATAAAVGGELRETGNSVRVCCFLVTACLYVRDLERAAQWSRYAIDMAGGRIASPSFDYPRTEHAAVLIWWGRWEQAEFELLELLQDAAARPVLAALARLRLADLRRRQGRFDEARSLLDELDAAPHRRGLGQLTVAARAALELDQDALEEAAALADRYLRLVPPQDLAERVDALEIAARARAALGDVEGAAPSVGELQEVATKIGTGPVLASARFAAGVVAGAGGDHPVALEDLQRAVDLFAKAEAPFEAARVRVELARCLLDLGRQGPAAKEAAAAHAAFDALGAQWEAERTERLLAEIEPGARGRPDLHLTRREVEVLRLLGQGRSNEEIAADLFLSVRTVERHVSNTYNKIGAHGRAARAMATAFAHRNAIA